jgi:hypothetical protein
MLEVWDTHFYEDELLRVISDILESGILASILVSLIKKRSKLTC